MKNPDEITWMSLLGACRKWNDVERAERVAEKCLEFGKDNAAVYVLLANIYASVGRHDDKDRIRNLMKERGVKKIPGMSWLEIDGKVHRFTVEDKSHEKTPEIYRELKKLTEEMKQEGYIAQTSFALHDISEEEKEAHLCGHSERLAITFALIHTPPSERIIIYKNLRVCGDCHTATCFISKVRNREIVVRDANRFHHFKDGKCSCNNFF